MKILFEKKIFLPTIIAIFAAALYLPALGIGFLSDDWHLLWIAKNSTQPWYAYFWTNYAGGIGGYAYRPIQTLFFIFADFLFGANPIGFHILQILIHAANAVLLYFLARKLFGAALPALVAAIFFAIFPNHPEAVIWNSAIGDPAAAFFSLLTWLCWLRAGESGKLRFYLLAYFSASLALLSKDMAVSLPFIIVLWELVNWRMKTGIKKTAIRLFSVLPFFLVLIGYFFVRAQASGYLFGYYGNPRLAIDPMVAIRTFLAIPVSHFFSAALRNQVMDYLYRVVDTRLEAFIIAFILAGILSAIRVSRRFWFILLAFCASIVPVMQFGISHLPGRLSDEGERYAYLPSIFLALILEIIFQKIWNRKNAVIKFASIGAVMIICLALSWQLFAKISDWRSASAIAREVFLTWQTAAKSARAPVITVGLPDNYRGVPLWRNGLNEAMELSSAKRPENKVLALRTAIDSSHQFQMEKISDQEFVYQSSFADIVGPREIQENGCHTSLRSPEFFVYALTYRDFAKEAAIKCEPRTSASSSFLFWLGDRWELVGFAAH